MLSLFFSFSLFLFFCSVVVWWVPVCVFMRWIFSQLGLSQKGNRPRPRPREERERRLYIEKERELWLGGYEKTKGEGGEGSSSPKSQSRAL